jgi:hypothetical protein
VTYFDCLSEEILVGTPGPKSLVKPKVVFIEDLSFKKVVIGEALVPFQ